MILQLAVNACTCSILCDKWTTNYVLLTVLALAEEALPSLLYSLVPSLIPSFYRLQYEKRGNSKKAGGGLGTRLLVIQVQHRKMSLYCLYFTGNFITFATNKLLLKPQSRLLIQINATPLILSAAPFKFKR